MSDPRIHCEFKTLLGLRSQADGFSLLPRYRSGSVLAGRHGSRFRGRGLNFEELRHYQEGDDIRTLDWRVTLRTGKPHVRAYSEEKDRYTILLIDQRQSMFFGSEESMKSVVAAHAAAVLGWRVLKDNDRIGALLLTDTGERWFAPQRNRDHWMRILGELARANQSLKVGSNGNGHEARLNGALQHLVRLGTKDAVILALSDFTGWDDRSLAALKRLQQHNDVLSCFILDPMERQLQLPERLVASDGLMQLEIRPDDRKLADKYRQAGADKLMALTKAFQRQGLPLITLDSSGDEIVQLKQALGVMA